VPSDADRRRLLSLAAIAAVGLAALVTGVVVGAGHDTEEATDDVVPEAGRAEPRTRVSFLARILPPAAPAREDEPRGPSVPRNVVDLARRLPVERKVAQLFVFGFPGRSTNAEVFGRLRRLDIGGFELTPANATDPAQAGALAAGIRRVARRSGRVPPLVLASQPGGELNTVAGLPPALPPADIASAREAAAGALDSGRALRELGITGVLGPSVDVGLEAGTPLGAEVYSDDPEEVAAFAEATVRAYRRARMFSSVEHFPGIGGADQSTDAGPASVGLDVPQLRDRDLIPFRAAIRAGVPAVTLGHALYSFSDFTVPASLSRIAATGLLRRELGFEGVALTDDLADPAVSTLASVPDAAVRAVRAGADMVRISGPAGDQQAAYVAVLRAVRDGRIERARLDEAIGRILVAKRNYGLLRG
jgi:beta-N-acetylhexosaminidase